MKTTTDEALALYRNTWSKARSKLVIAGHVLQTPKFQHKEKGGCYEINGLVHGAGPDKNRILVTYYKVEDAGNPVKKIFARDLFSWNEKMEVIE